MNIAFHISIFPLKSAFKIILVMRISHRTGSESPGAGTGKPSAHRPIRLNDDDRSPTPVGSCRHRVVVGLAFHISILISNLGTLSGRQFVLVGVSW